MGFLRRFLGPAGNDANPVEMRVVPFWGPDAYARRFSVLNILRGSSFSPASIGIGVRPAPPGSAMERTKTNALLPPQQQFRGVTNAIARPSMITTKPAASFPGANVAINPVLFGLNKPRTPFTGWSGDTDGE